MIKEGQNAEKRKREDSECQGVQGDQKCRERPSDWGRKLEGNWDPQVGGNYEENDP